MALLAVEEAGNGEPLVLVHGLATTREIWAAVRPELSRSRRVITLDVPGFGESAPAGPGFELDVVADRIARGLAAHGVRGPFDLVGHSLGAALALMLAARRPRTVRRLVLVAPAGLTAMPRLAALALSRGAGPVLAFRRALAPLTDLDWGRRLLLGFAAADGARIPPLQARLMVGASASAKRTSEALATITSADLRPLLRRAPAPLGVIWGAQDRTVPARHAGAVRVARPDAKVVIMDQAGHVAMIERPFPKTQQLSVATRLSCSEQAFPPGTMRPTDTDHDAVLLDDGRRLTYAESGPRDGTPVIYCHGAIGTQLRGSVDLDAITWDLGVRHIAVSRPGIGGSDPAVRRSVLDFGGDLRQLADALSLERFCVIAAHAAPSERARLQQPDERRAASASFLDASGDGVRGMIEDYLTYSRGWGFSVSEVRARVHLWHGVNDPLVPIEHALQLAAALPDCHVFFDPDEGHHFFRRRLAEILAALTGRDDRVVRRYVGEHPGRKGEALPRVASRRAAAADAESMGRRLREAA
jgi:pimeloyl-ACP methyl ester carboxylesterase